MKGEKGRLEGVIYPLPAFEVGAVKFWRAKKITHFRNFFLPRVLGWIPRIMVGGAIGMKMIR